MKKKSSFNEYFNKKEIWIIPLFLTFILSIPMFIWLALDNSLPHWDMGRHLWTSLQYGRLWYDFIAGHDSLRHLITAYFYYPPLVYQPAILFYIILGVSQKIAVLSNFFWLFIAIFAIYRSAVLLWNKKTGLAAVLLFLSMPMIIAMTHQFQIDLPLSAWVALTFYAMLLFSCKPSMKYAIWLGIIAGLGLLLKWTYLLFIIPMAAVVISQMILEKRFKVRENLKEVFISALLAFAIAGPWYLANRANVRADFVANGITAAVREGDPVGFTPEAFGYYLSGLYHYYLLVPILIIFLAGIVLTLVKKELIRKNLTLILILALFYLLISVLPNKDLRYIMPAAPFIALLGATVMKGIRRQKVYLGILIIILTLNNLSVAFGITNGKNIKPKGLELLAGTGYTSGKPAAEICPMENIVASIPQDASARLIGNNPIEFNNWALAYNLEKSGRVWAGEGTNIMDSDYWIVRLDGSNISKDTLFYYQDYARVVTNFDCTDRSLVIILKNSFKGNVHLPTY